MPLMRVPNEDGRDRNVPEIDHRSEQYNIKIDREETNDGDTDIGFQCVLRRYPHSLPIVHVIAACPSLREIPWTKFELIDKGCQDKLISVEGSWSEGYKGKRN